MEVKDFARRLKSISPRNDEEHRVFTFALGAIYAAAWAEALGYSDASEPNVAELIDDARRSVLEDLAEGNLPFEGRWAAGFYFNDVLFRTDVAFERLTRYVTRDYASSAPAQEDLPSALRDAWAPIHEEVIGLKHYPHLGRRTLHKELVGGLDALVSSLELYFNEPERTAPPKVKVRRRQHFGST